VGGASMSDKSSEFKLERYKYILQQLHSLNENIHKYLTIFQVLITAIVGGIVTVFVNWKNLNINVETAAVGIRGLLGLLIISSLFVIVSILAGLFSWFDYRNEEVRLLNESVRPSFRHKPKLRNFWRWYETYMILFILIATVFIYRYVENQIIPIMK
jgi:heme/copper-type cytochrome/quinol oxidase subunit 2